MPQTSPYTSIYPEGSLHYTEAPLGEQERRYSQLIQRMVQYLPPDDPVVTGTVPELQQGLKAFGEAATELEAALNAQEIARTDLENARVAFKELMNQTYGMLLQKYPKKRVERFFPRTRSTRTEASSSGTAEAP